MGLIQKYREKIFKILTLKKGARNIQKYIANTEIHKYIVNTHGHDDDEAGGHVGMEEVVTQSSLEREHNLEAREVTCGTHVNVAMYLCVCLHSFFKTACVTFR